MVAGSAMCLLAELGLPGGVQGMLRDVFYGGRQCVNRGEVGVNSTEHAGCSSALWLALVAVKLAVRRPRCPLNVTVIAATMQDSCNYS